jgi:transcriptional regulator
MPALGIYVYYVRQHIGTHKPLWLHVSRREKTVFSPEEKKGSVELIVLAILQDEPRHGYEIGQVVQARSGGKLEYPLSTLYPVLYRMENRGWIKGRWVEKSGERRRCYYRLTAAGKRALAEKRRSWRALTETVDLVIDTSHA